MADQDGLLRLDDDDTSASLKAVSGISLSIASTALPYSLSTHLSEVDTSVLDLESDESLAGNVHTLGESLGLSSLGAAQDGGELLLLLGLDLFTCNPFGQPDDSRNLSPPLRGTGGPVR